MNGYGYFCKYHYSMHLWESNYFISIFNQYIFIISYKSIFYDGIILNIYVSTLSNHLFVCACMSINSWTQKQLLV